MMLKALFLDENGQGTTEYGLMLGGIAFAAVVFIVALREEIGEMLNEVITAVTHRNDSVN